MSRSVGRRVHARYASTVLIGLAEFTLAVSLTGCESAAFFKPTRVDFPSKKPSLSVATNLGESRATFEAILSQSPCLWIAKGDTPRLNWEAVVEMVIDPPNETFHIGSCDLRNVDSPDGTFDGIDGRRFESEHTFAQLAGGSFERCALRSIRDISSCEVDTRLYEACSLVQPVCTADPRNWNMPYCGKDCLQPIPTDGAFAFKFPRRPELGGGERIQGDHRAFVSPYYFRVERSRPVRQRLSFNKDARPADAGRLAFQWPASDADKGNLREDFSPTLFISKVRAFRCPGPDPSLPFNYLKLDKLGVDMVTVQNCSPDDYDRTVIPMAKCPKLRSTTPTRSGTSPQEFVNVQTWRVEVPDGSPGGNEGLQSSEAVCVEFHVNDSESTATPQIQLPYRLPDQYMSATPAVVRHAGRFHNDHGGASGHSLQAWRIENGSPGFSFELDNIAGLPSAFDGSDPKLLAGSSIYLNAIVDRSQEGNKEATVVLSFLDSDRQPREVRETVRVSVLGPGLLEVAPDRLDLPINTRPPWQKRLAIVNGGPSPLVVRAIAVTGPNSAYYRLYEENGSTPLPRTAEIGPGETKVIMVSLCPRVQGELDLSATLDIVADDGRVPTTQVWKRVPVRARGQITTHAICFQ